MDINREEVREAIKRLKDGKALGWDEIPGEAWKYGEEGVEDWIWECCNREAEDGRKVGWKE